MIQVDGFYLADRSINRKGLFPVQAVRLEGLRVKIPSELSDAVMSV